MRALIWFGSTQSRRREASQFTMKASRPEIIVMIYFIKAEIPGKIWNRIRSEKVSQPLKTTSISRAPIGAVLIYGEYRRSLIGAQLLIAPCRSSTGFGLMTPEGKDVMPS